MSDSERAARVQKLIAAASRLQDASTELGQRTRELVRESSGLSREGVELGLRRCLETRATEAEIRKLCGSVTPTARAHVLLSANVFTAPLRALALASAAAREVFVRTSRREPHVTRLLLQCCPGAYEIVDSLTPLASDQLWAYGTEQTLTDVRSALPAGVLFHAHGPGFGAVVFEPGAPVSDDVLSELVADVIVFDQRGCLSPRLVLLGPDTEGGRRFASRIASGLAAMAQKVPLGALTPDEHADMRRYRETLLYAGEVFAAGAGVVGLDVDPRALAVAPVGRNLHVMCVRDIAATLSEAAHMLTTVGVHGSAAFRGAIAGLLPHARICDVGQMQTPAFDGPVDRRAVHTAT